MSFRKLVKFISIFLISTFVLYYILPKKYSNNNKKSTDDLIIDQQQTTEFNTTWDEYNPWILDVNTEETNFLKKLTTYSTQGHSNDTLYNTQFENYQGDLTIVLPIYSKDALLNLNSISSWSLPIPFQILIVASSKLKSQIEERISNGNKIRISIMDRPTINQHPFGPGTAGSSVWLQYLNEEIDTDYVYLLDENVPSVHLEELPYLLQVKQHEDYKNSFIGTKTLVLAPQDTAQDHFCLPVNTELPIYVSQPADMILGGWLLEKSWLPYIIKDLSIDSLTLPLGHYLSLTLNQQLGIPTIYLPPVRAQPIYNKQICDQVHTNWVKHKGWKSLVHKNRFPTALQYRTIAQQHKKNVMFIVDGANQFVSLYPLLCRYKKDPVHLTLIGNDIDGSTAQQALKETSCNVTIQIHDFSNIKDQDKHLNHLVAHIQPSILIQIKPTEVEDAFMYRVIQAIAKIHQVVDINLPENEIAHALWIPDLSLEALTNWNRIQIKLVVITDRRPHSLSRLLQSAAKSIYIGDKVDLLIHLEQSADRVTRMLVNSFVWNQGQKLLRHRVRKGGLMPAIVESWYPSHNDEYAVLLEDDIEVSPLFYAWSKYAILKYRYSGNKEAYRLMYGISLYAPRNLELIPSGRVKYDPNDVLLPAGYASHTPYASQIPCSWGAVYFPEHWREFHTYLVRRLEDLSLPKDNQVRLISVPKSRSDKWKKSWKKYFIELVYLRAYVMLYPNFEDFEAFSTNHVEFGTHVQSEKRQSVIGTFMVPLMQRDTILSQLPNQSLPLFDDLPVLDLWGQLQSHEKLELIASQYHQHVSTCPRTYGTFDPQEFFCVVDGPPDPLQEFPMSPKKPKPPVLVKDTVQPIEYNYVYEYSEEQLENARNQQHEYGPKPIDVAQLPLIEDRYSNKEDELLDLESDLDLLNRLYLKLNPENLNYLENERFELEEEEEEEEEQDDQEEQEFNNLQVGNEELE